MFWAFEEVMTPRCVVHPAWCKLCNWCCFCEHARLHHLQKKRISWAQKCRKLTKQWREKQPLSTGSDNSCEQSTLVQRGTIYGCDYVANVFLTPPDLCMNSLVFLSVIVSGGAGGCLHLLPRKCQFRWESAAFYHTRVTSNKVLIFYLYFLISSLLLFNSY